jgi:hypothetical protein
MRSLTVDDTDPLTRVYPFFVSFFRDRNRITSGDFVVVANAAYGWMPRMLKLRGTDEDWAKAAQILNRAKRNRITESDDLETLKRLINKSLVGPSKLLHFANPRKHAIWDSRVYRYLAKERPDHSRLLKLDNYRRYLEICDEIASWPEIAGATKQVSKRLGYPVTPFRAIELTMWANGAKK